MALDYALRKRRCVSACVSASIRIHTRGDGIHMLAHSSPFRTAGTTRSSLSETRVRWS